MFSRGGGRFEAGIWEDRGGIETLEANGAVVGGINAASGFHGAVLLSNKSERRPSSFLRLLSLLPSMEIGICPVVPEGVPRPPLLTFGLAFFSRPGLLALRPVIVVSVMCVRSVVRFSPMIVPAPLRFAVRRDPVPVVGSGGVARSPARGREAVSRALRRVESA